MHRYVHRGIIDNSQNTETTEVTHVCTNKEDVVYMYNELLLSHKKRMKSCYCNTMDALEGIMLNEMSVGERQILYDFAYTWNLKYEQKTK